MASKQICSRSGHGDPEHEGYQTRYRSKHKSNHSSKQTNEKRQCPKRKTLKMSFSTHDDLESSDQTKNGAYSSESWLPPGHYEDSQTTESDKNYTGKLSSKQSNQEQQNPKGEVHKIIRSAQYKYTLQEVERAANLLNADDTFFDNPHKFEDLFCLQNIYRNDKRNRSMVTLSRLCDEARKCLENRDWEHLVLVILRGLQCPREKTLMENFVLMEILYDPAIKHSEIAKQCLSLIFPNCHPKILLKKLTVIPDSSNNSERFNRRCSR